MDEYEGAIKEALAPATVSPHCWLLISPLCVSTCQSTRLSQSWTVTTRTLIF